tara:strand:+ start:657 stop:947 length:291 start_codon:yes stop_codon:yes gene_type:complete
MKNLNQIENTIPKETEEAKYLMMLCQESPDIVIKTEFGLGKYKFVQFSELQGNLVLKFNLMNDKHFKDTTSIYANIGETCFLSISQYLYIYNTATA